MAGTTSLKDRAVRGPNGSAKATWRASVVAVAAVAVAFGMAGCSSGFSTQSSASSAPSTTARPAATTTPSSGSGGITQAAVLNAWESAQQTLYGYMQQPWPQVRADLVAGE